MPVEGLVQDECQAYVRVADRMRRVCLILQSPTSHVMLQLDLISGSYESDWEIP